jgi:hypothetical protein
MTEIKVKRSEFKARMNKFRQLVGLNLVNELIRVAPVDTGFLRNNIKSRVVGNDVVISMPEYWLYLEFGTGLYGPSKAKYKIVPKNAKSLHWKEKGKDFFAKEVWHPGIRPYPFVRNTLRTKLSSIISSSLRGAFS